MAAMYMNLKAEQARFGYTNDEVAEYIGMTQSSYEAKLRTGKFYVFEAAKLCRLFKVDFQYLFADEKQDAS